MRNPHTNSPPMAWPPPRAAMVVLELPNGLTAAEVRERIESARPEIIESLRDADAMLHRLRSAGVSVTVTGDQRVIALPKELVSAGLRRSLQERWLEFVMLLPHPKWRIVDVTGEAREVHCQPPMTLHQLDSCYRGGRVMHLYPILDSSSSSPRAAFPACGARAFQFAD